LGVDHAREGGTGTEIWSGKISREQMSKGKLNFFPYRYYAVVFRKLERVTAIYRLLVKDCTIV
jgi:hypothetical protein